MNLENPYRPPEAIDDEESVEDQFTKRVPQWILRTWPLVFVANLIVPGLFSVIVLEHYAFVGLLAACAVLLVAGWWILNRFSSFAGSILAGGGVMAASQLFPILQVMAGFLSLVLAAILGLTVPPEDDHSGAQINSILGGFVVTFLVGSILMTTSIGIGYLIHLIFNRRPRKSDASN